jgi:hypothetical protein
VAVEAGTSRLGFRSWIGQVAPQVVEVAVAGGAGGVVAQSTKHPELVVVIDPARRVAAAARCPILEGLVRERLIVSSP